ncbi:MAG: DNA alkylation repair protein [Bacteroidetes bacterium]|nr:DNA alkylation repair protein [Bacteroidota bacterium]MCH8032639.1 DNA alkylation repair protein [Bacteroidota bacterium]
MNLKELKKTIRANANKDHAKTMQWFFKTGKGEYGEGDKFIGIKVPVQRKIAKKFGELDLEDLQKLLNSKIHEERLISLLILVDKYDKADEKVKDKIYRFYKKNRRKINNWDLVDLSAPKILGIHLLNHDKQILYKYAHSKNLWEKRISIISTYSFIKNHDFNTTLEISDILLNDDQDLIHKAVGWMLREVGKQSLQILEKFLKPRYKKMPRTMLRYSIEKFPEKKRKKYLKGEI